MGKTVLLLGRKGMVVDDAREKLSVADVEVLAGTSLDDVRTAFDGKRVDMVIMGAGIDLAVRLEIVKHIFTVSDATTVHMKDFESGPAGMLPFVNGILKGLLA
jgi:hypothetical protein